ncbi:MAG: NUDIX domain-containing protein [Candidatus Binataceae bacterium]
MAEQQFFVGMHSAIVSRGRMLVLRRAASLSYQPGAWDLPGGHLALGEDLEQCLAREIKEETGLDIAVDRLLCVHKTPAEPYLQAIYACHVAVYQRVALRPAEHEESRWVTLDELASLDLIPYLAGILRRRILDYVRA